MPADSLQGDQPGGFPGPGGATEAPWTSSQREESRVDEVMEHAPEGPAGPLAVETPRRVALTRVGAFGAALLGTLGVRAAAEAKGKTKHHRAKDQRHASAAKGKTPGPPGPTGPTGLLRSGCGPSPLASQLTIRRSDRNTLHLVNPDR